LGSANLDTQLGNIATATNAGDLASKAADAGSLTTGTNTSGSYTDTASDNDTYWITAPVTPAVGGFGLRQSITFNLPLGRVPTSLDLRGYWNGNGQTADVYAYNSRTASYDKLTNTGTNLTSRSSETTYNFTLPRDYADDSGGAFNVVIIEFRSASTNTGHRLRVDRALVYHVDEEVSATVTVPTVQQIWAFGERTLTGSTGENVEAPTAEEVATAVVAACSTAYGVTGTVNADGSETATAFKTDLTQANDFFNNSFLLFTSGSLDGQSRKISDFANTDGVVTLATALTSAPADGSGFIIVGRSE
jgi:hypothetical protein